jgi:hypothetical protein
MIHRGILNPNSDNFQKNLEGIIRSHAINRTDLAIMQLKEARRHLTGFLLTDRGMIGNLIDKLSKTEDNLK